MSEYAGQPARPTVYNGIEMRSRLEARFAAWLDSAPAVPWEYEPKAYANRHGQYLPDFVIRQPDRPTLYIEVKPTSDLAWDITKRMRTIWDSDPDGEIVVAYPDGEKWRFLECGWRLASGEAPADDDARAEEVELLEWRVSDLAAEVERLEAENGSLKAALRAIEDRQTYTGNGILEGISDILSRALGTGG